MSVGVVGRCPGGLDVGLSIVPQCVPELFGHVVVSVKLSRAILHRLERTLNTMGV